MRLKKALRVNAGKIRSTPRRDYPYRMDLNRGAFADYVRRKVETIRYTNFKDGWSGGVA